MHSVYPFFPASSTGLIYIDPTNLRRSSAISSSAAAAAAALEASNSSSYLTSASSLARAYSIVIRQISDLMSLIPKYNHLVYSQYPAAVKLTYHDAVTLQVRSTHHQRLRSRAHFGPEQLPFDTIVASFVGFFVVKTEFRGGKADSHLELDGVHHGFHRGSAALRLCVVVRRGPRPPQSPTARLSALRSQGARQCSGGG